MTELPDDLPEPVVRQRRALNPSLIWLVPIVAALAGLLLILRTFLAAGPSILLSFDTAEDLEAGRTEVRYKQVVIGKVSHIELSEDRSHVLVRVDLIREAANVAVEDSEFWVARVRADMGGISGFKTLVTGTYIGVNIGKSTTRKRRFVGLEKPPSLTNDQKGRRFLLKATDLGSLNVGSPVYLRRIPVGRVVSFDLDDDGKGVSVGAFVAEPYDRFVTRNVRFWNASGIDLSLDARGFKLDTQSLVTLLAGGVAFQPLSGEESSEPAPENTSFVLHPSQDVAMTQEDSIKMPVRMRFAESTRGLAIDSPVDFQGITLGRVTDVQLSYDVTQKRFIAEVSADLHPQRLGRAYQELAAGEAVGANGSEAVFRRLIEQGLRAELRAGNLITGQLFVALDFPAHPREQKIELESRPLLIPTELASLDQMQKRITDIVTQVDRIPFADIGNRLRDALGNANALLQRLDTELAPTAIAALRSAQTTLDTANRTLAAPEAPLQQDLHQTLDEVDRAARSLRDLSDYLQRHPESLIRGRKNADDTEDLHHE